ncbi:MULTISPECIES: YdcF family protein [unclassified Rhodococcus (in: high G+C Gram-positive bacteria)]|uniref:YdcF family protein n=1 Tax=unclassified Rhodococcus (in: high G+C Gram-positive bacteria) TaxID=192944 RepID=UPI001FFB1113|nr:MULTISPECIES: YdcF family protein [unclassified Rhodococcus (in: high G+C Gram-positive bacteria)]
MIRRSPLVIVAIMLPVLLVSLIGFGGYLTFTRAAIDPVTPADAIIVLGGEHDGREAYGVSLAEQGVADTVVLSDPYGSKDPVMKKYCDKKTAEYTVLCVDPIPGTTRGEAIFTQQLAQERGWKHVIVVSWRYHLPRARFIFGQCFDGDVTMRPVPRTYGFSLVQWEYTYLYQLAGFVKAGVQGGCEDV